MPTVMPKWPCRSIIPGITKRPVKSTASAPAGALRLEAGPIHVIRPASTTMAEFGAGALPVPSISVKPRRTRTSALETSALNEGPTVSATPSSNTDA